MTEQPAVRSRRRTWSVVGVVVAAAAGCLAATLLVMGLPFAVGTTAGHPDDDTPSSDDRTDTAEVVRGDLTGTTTKAGRLGLLDGPTVAGGVAGVLTGLPQPGDRLASRSTLYSVDNAPVVAVEGALPQWREFSLGMEPGPDVRQLEESLHAWGHLKAAPDDRFDQRTATAVSAWQKEVGLPRTAVVERGRIQFVTGEFVVAETSAAVGDPIGGAGPVYTTSRTERVVAVDLPVGSPLARLDGVVSIELPGGTSAPGHVSAVGAPRATDGGSTVVPVSLVFDDPAAAGDLTDASVSVDFVSEVQHDVLSVPVTALGAAVEGGFVVEVVAADGTTTAVPVEAGLFAGDRVAVTGAVEAGDRVVVPRA